MDKGVDAGWETLKSGGLIVWLFKLLKGLEVPWFGGELISVSAGEVFKALRVLSELVLLSPDLAKEIWLDVNLEGD